MFKRNQVEEAIRRVLEADLLKPGNNLRPRLKRLLDTDRELGRNRRSVDPERVTFAFYSNDGPGKGAENEFSEYEAFALFAGYQMMQHGWTQGFVVALLRRIRPELEREHRRILAQDPAVLFDEEKIARSLKPGRLRVPASLDPRYLVMVSSEEDRRLIKSRICDHEQLEIFLRNERLGRSKGLGLAFSVLPLVNSAHQLHLELMKSEPRKRGRTASK